MLDNFTPDTARCAFLKGDKCSETERPSGRIKKCLREYGDECEEYNTHCPECGEELKHYSGYTEYDYCTSCNDVGYLDGKPIIKLTED